MEGLAKGVEIMDDLISRAAAIECAIDAVDDWDGGWNPNRETVIRKYFEELTAVDAVPVVHARWVEETDHSYHWHCSKCKQVWGITKYFMKYCPNCGAKMDGDENG